VEINFEIHDGFAVGCHQGREYLMLYPIVSDVQQSPRLLDTVENYMGERLVDGAAPALRDIAVTFGKIVSSRQLPLLLGLHDSVIRLDADIDVCTALDIINGAVRDDIRAFSLRDIPPVDSLPAKSGGKLMSGYLVLRADSPAEFIPQPLASQEVAAIENEAIENGTFESLDVYCRMAQEHNLQARFTDVRFTKSAAGIYTLDCCIDGRQMPSKRLTAGESAKVQHHIDRDIDPLTALGYRVFLRKFSEELKGKDFPGVGVKAPPAPKNYREFRQMLEAEFPSGLTLQVFGVDGQQFLKLATAVTDDTRRLTAGELHPTISYLTAKVAAGDIHPDDHPGKTLYTTVSVKPDMYDYVLPALVSDADCPRQDLLDVSASRQFALASGDWKQVSLQIPECLEFRDAMLVENVPFREVFRIYNDCNDHKILYIDELAEYLVLDKYQRLGSGAAVKPTPLNSGVLQHMQAKFPDGGLHDALREHDISKEAHFLMREKGLLPVNEFNLDFVCTGHDASDNAMRVTEGLNLSFPFVSAFCYGAQVSVSLGTRNPRKQAAVERYIDSCKVTNRLPLVKPFNDLSDKNRVFYLLASGQIVDAYVKRPGTGLKNRYRIDKDGDRFFLQKQDDTGVSAQTQGIATRDCIHGGRQQVYDFFRMGGDYKRVTEASVYQLRGGGSPLQWLVRCRIDGMQEMGRPLSPSLNSIVNRMTDNGRKSPDAGQWNLLRHYAAVRTFRDILMTDDRTVSGGLRR